jgi:large subunit ribosomal protein L27
MAHKKGQGSCRNGRRSRPKYRGIKCYAGESVQSGSIIVRQLGSRFHPGRGVRMGNDYTLYAVREGVVEFQSNRRVHVVERPAPVTA